jgi:catechol 2,3-dioxygenase-like lactoylglutathione lyase family enzyme
VRTAIPVLHVADSQAAEAFYCQGLGFHVESAWRPTSAADPAYLVIQRDDARLHLSSFPDDGIPGSLIMIPVTDVDTLHAEFRTRGVPIDLPPTDQTWGNREMFVRDPDRNKIVFAQPLFS